MLYIQNKLIMYPGRTVMEDVLSRTGKPGKYAYTPYPGMIGIFKKQFEGQGEVSEADFIRYCSEGSNEFNPSILKPDDSLDSLTIEEALTCNTSGQENARCSDTFFWRLEDIDENWVARYVNQKAIGYKREKNGRAAYVAAVATDPVVHDLETNAPKSLGELVEHTQNKDILEVLKAKEKLPFLLKQLHKGSILKKASLMSFIIAIEKAHKRFRAGQVDRVVFMIEPKDFYTYATTYEMQADGRFGRAFEAKDNKCAKFREVVAWAKGEDINDPYFGYYKELLNVAAVLGISLADEDPRVYQGEFIQQMECTYLASNMEYLKNSVYMDRNVLNILTPDKLFQRGVLEITSNEDEALRVPNSIQQARTRLSNIQDTVQKYEVDFDTASDRIQEMFKVLARNTKTRLKKVVDYTVEGGLLRDSSGQYLIVNPATIIVDAVNSNCYVAANGWLVLDQDSIDSLSYYDLNTCSQVDERVFKYVTKLTRKAV